MIVAGVCADLLLLGQRYSVGVGRDVRDEGRGRRSEGGVDGVIVGGGWRVESQRELFQNS